MFFPWQALLHRPHTFCRFLFLPNLPLILIIGIASQPCKLHALGIVQCSAKRFAVRAYHPLGFSGFLGLKPITFSVANLFSV